MAQEMALFTCLEVPWQPQSNRLVDPDNTVVVKLSISTGARQARFSILEYLTTYIYPDTDALGVLTTLLDRWREIGTTQVRVETGSVGAVQGVTMVFEEERNEIRRQVCTIVPFYKAHQQIERQMSSSFALAPVIR
jgi:hypothetical protein